MKLRTKILSVLAVVLGVVLIGAGGYAVGATTAATIHGCTNNKTHALTVTAACPRGTTPLVWNQSGPQGLPGTPGAAGATTAGPTGLDVMDVSGDSHASSSASATCPVDHPYALGGGGFADSTPYPELIVSEPISQKGLPQGWFVEFSATANLIGVWVVCSK